MLLGEEFDGDDLEGDALRQRLFAAFIRSIDAQSGLLRSGVRWTLAGGFTTLLVWVVILADKIGMVT